MTGDAGPGGGSHVPVLGLAQLMYAFFASLLLPLPLRSLAPSGHLLPFPPLPFSLAIPLLRLGILPYAKQFLEVRGLIVAPFCEPASL